MSRMKVYDWVLYCEEVPCLARVFFGLTESEMKERSYESIGTINGIQAPTVYKRIRQTMKRRGG